MPYEPNTVNIIQASRLCWAGHVEQMDENELPGKYSGQILEANGDVAVRNQDGLMG